MFVRIDGALKTVSEFVAMPLEVFKQSVQFCQSGLDLCRSQIEKIKERLKNQRLARLEQSATVGGSVTKQADKTSSHAVG